MNELDVGSGQPFSSNISQGCVPSPGRHSFCNSSPKKVNTMFFVGIDIAKNSHEAAVIDECGSIVVKPFKFPNSLGGFEKFLAAVKGVSEDLTQFEFGMEATGHYWLNLYTKLMDFNVAVHVINPVQSDALRGLYIRKTKNDAKDAFIIAELIRFGKYSETMLSDSDLLSLRELTRQRFYLVDCVSDAKRKAISFIDKIFPEYQTLFSDTFGATSVELLQNYTSPDVIAELDTELFTRFLKSVSHGRFGKAKAEEIQYAAKNTFGSFLFADSATLAIRQFIQQIKLLEEQIAELENFISEMFASFDCKLDTIVGVGTTLAASFLAEIGDITRFESPDKLAAFAGIDPSVKQSGEFNGTRNKMSKRGSPYLRRTFWLAAVSGIRSNPALKAIYEKKRAQGKHHAVAVSAVMHKLCNIVFAIMNTNEPYKIILSE